MKLKFFLYMFSLCLFSCGGEIIPKPKAMLRLDYERLDYALTNNGPCAFNFEANQLAVTKLKEGCNMELDYPLMNGAIYLTYKPVEGNLNKLLTDAQRLSYEHVVKADNITEQPFLNDKKNVYGMFYEVTGNAASQSQFYVTDSINHFVTGSLYFYAKPNYDSIYPAAIYLQRDIRKIMESLEWRD